MGETTPADKRQRRRVPFIDDAVFETETGSRFMGVCRNVSMSGMLLTMERPPAIGTRGRVVFTLSSGEERLVIRADCEVVRSVAESTVGDEPIFVGLHFTRLDPDSSIHLFNVVRYQELAGDDPDNAV